MGAHLSQVSDSRAPAGPKPSSLPGQQGGLVTVPVGREEGRLASVCPPCPPHLAPTQPPTTQTKGPREVSMPEPPGTLPVCSRVWSSRSPAYWTQVPPAAPQLGEEEEATSDTRGGAQTPYLLTPNRSAWRSHWRKTEMHRKKALRVRSRH